jgi:hypothetical protein
LPEILDIPLPGLNFLLLFCYSRPVDKAIESKHTHYELITDYFLRLGEIVPCNFLTHLTFSLTSVRKTDITPSVCGQKADRGAT